MQDGRLAGTKKILVVDDDPQIRNLLTILLGKEGYEVECAANANETWSRLDSGAIRLITLDINLGGDDGFALAREIRARCDVPIIMISGKVDDIDRIVGLELGADDYITKPFNLREVLARVKAVLRRYEVRAPAPTQATPEHDRLRFGDWIVDLPGRRVESSTGGPLELTTAEFNLLALFAERPRRVLSRDTILDLLRGIEWSPLDRSVDTLVGRLRKKIEADPDHPQFVKTVRGVGYVFTPEVVRGV